MIKKSQILTALFVVLCFWTGSLRAGLITIYLTAEITYIYDPPDLLEGKVTVGDIITGSYSYDSDTPDDLPISNAGVYLHNSPPYGISLSVGGFVFRTDPDNVEFVLAIDNGTYGTDSYGLRSYNNLPLSNGVEVDHIHWQLDDNTRTALSSDALPTTPPVLQDWQYDRGLQASFGLYGNSYIDARVTSAVPEPATVLLLTLGSLLLTRRRR